MKVLVIVDFPLQIPYPGNFVLSSLAPKQFDQSECMIFQTIISHKRVEIRPVGKLEKWGHAVYFAILCFCVSLGMFFVKSVAKVTFFSHF